MINFLLTFFISLSAYSAENIRFFSAIDSKAKISLLEITEANNLKLYFKLTGTSESENEKVILFKKLTEDRYAPVNEVSNLILIDYDKKTLIKGTIKKVWTLAGLKKDILFHETTPPKDLSAKKIIEDYELAEGAKFLNVKIAIDTAQAYIKDKCKSSAKVKFSDFAQAPNYKAVAGIEGLTALCSDADYLKAIQGLKEVNLKSSKSYETPAMTIKNNNLTIDFGKNSENTMLNIKNLSEKTL